MPTPGIFTVIIIILAGIPIRIKKKSEPFS